MKKQAIIFITVAIFVAVLAGLFVQSLKMEKETKVLPSQPQIDPISETDWVKGSKEAKVSIIEYSDLQCPACKAYYPVTKQLIEELKDSMTFAYRHFPLRQTHFNAQIAAQAAEAAGKQGKFWEYHDLMFDNQEEWSPIQDPKELFYKYAERLTLDLEKFKTDLESQEVKDEVEKDYQGGLKALVNATPTFYLNGKKMQNPKNLEEFRSIIQKEIENNE